ncbi:hypothetical protein M569_07497 [Genlisea aurea]|uniref:Oleosin n=1 Tax=Genlisea aurea TaxID=192259 RepID=S8CQX1_9LAMI|nr:hypothetical protein M569_07497 [Genlisea aurea]
MIDRSLITSPSGAKSGVFFMQKRREDATVSSQVVGLASLAISGGILLLLTGVTLTTSVLILILSVPFLLITSPIWIPAGFLIFISVAGFGFAVAAKVVLSRVYKYFVGPSSGRVTEKGHHYY